MKKLAFALVVFLAPSLVATANAPKKVVVVNCPDLKCCPPLREGEVCVYVDTMTCTDEKGKPIPC